MLPRDKSGMRKLGEENLDQCRAEPLCNELSVLRDFKLMKNLFMSTGGCIIKGGAMLFGAKV